MTASRQQQASQAEKLIQDEGLPNMLSRCSHYTLCAARVIFVTVQCTADGSVNDTSLCTDDVDSTAEAGQDSQRQQLQSSSTGPAASQPATSSASRLPLATVKSTAAPAGSSLYISISNGGQLTANWKVCVQSMVRCSTSRPLRTKPLARAKDMC